VGMDAEIEAAARGAVHQLSTLADLPALLDGSTLI